MLWSAASVEQQARVAQDAWEDLIGRQLVGLREDKAKDSVYSVGVNDSGGREWRVASSYLLGPMVLGIPSERQTNAVTKRLADVMRTLGWTKLPTTIRVGKVVCRGFTRSIAEPIAEPKPKEVAAPVAAPVAVDAPVVVAPVAPRLIRRLVRER
jgi:hypothetical protein